LGLWVLASSPAAAQTKAPAAAPPEGEPAGEIAVRTWPDRTALWVGDRVTFTVEIECAPAVDIVTDDLSQEKLTLDGLELVDTTVEREESAAGQVTYRFHYRLTAYDALATRLQIGTMGVRYGRRRAGQQVDEEVRAGEVAVPGAMLALRSTIPDALDAVAVRDRRPMAAVPLVVRLARPIGLGLLLVSAVPLLVWIVALVRKRQPKVKRGSTRAERSRSRQDLEGIDTSIAGSEAERRDAYARLDGVVRRHVASVSGLPAEALTPSELERRLGEKTSRLAPETVRAMLDECERAKYGPARELPSGDRLRDSIGTAQSILAVSR
jgi:hypothetical protein